MAILGSCIVLLGNGGLVLQSADFLRKSIIMTAVGTTAFSWVLASSFSYESPEASTYMLAAATQVFGVGMLLPLIGALIVSYWKPHPLAQG